MASKLDRLIRNHDRTRCSAAFLEGESKLLDIHLRKMKLVIFLISGGLSEVYLLDRAASFSSFLGLFLFSCQSCLGKQLTRSGWENYSILNLEFITLESYSFQRH